jgi:hypothetical protein
MQRSAKVDDQPQSFEILEDQTPHSKFVVPMEYLNKLESILEAHMAKPNSCFKTLKPIPFKELTPGLIERECLKKGVPLYVTGVCSNWNKDLFR